MIAKIFSWAAIYLMIWWVTFFCFLPLWNVSHHEAGVKIGDGSDPGSPLTHNLGKKVRMNTLAATIVWLIMLVFVQFIHIPLPEIPG